MRSRTVFLFFPLVVLLLCSCKGKEQEKPKARPAAPVAVVSAGTGTVPVYIEATGTVEALSQVSIKAMVNGEITRVHFREGDDVSRGAVLFTLDSRPYEAALKKAEADLVRIKAQLVAARNNADRYGKLVKDGIVTSEQYDSFRTQADSLEADLDAQKANIESLRVQQSYCTIRSPISGRTGNLLIHAGNIVKANDTVSLVTINQIRPIHVSFVVPERELSRIRPFLAREKLKLEARVAGDSGPSETGEVIFLDNTVDPATATIKLKGIFANTKSRLWPGQFATVRLNLTSIADAVTVPSQAVQTGQNGQYLFVVSGDTAELRPVKAGVTHEGVTVIEQGLKPGEMVVIDGQMRVVPGGKVTVKPAGEKPGAGKTEKSPASAVSARP